ncbi:hypothetical protein SCA6_002591 [Theobroma cacao]
MRLIKHESLLMGLMRTNLNYYPICLNPELTVGVGHEIGGLFVRSNQGDNWIHVPPIKGSIVINVGDSLQTMSNGSYRSVEHRVVANRSKSRISVPIFVNPRPGDKIGPLPELVASNENQFTSKFSIQIMSNISSVRPIMERKQLNLNYKHNHFFFIHSNKSLIC